MTSVDPLTMLTFCGSEVHLVETNKMFNYITIPTMFLSKVIDLLAVSTGLSYRRSLSWSLGLRELKFTHCIRYRYFLLDNVTWD